MRFRTQQEENLEINLIPLIDVLLVIIIFLMVSTTFQHFSGLPIQLPQANAQSLNNDAERYVLAVSSKGEYQINNQILKFTDENCTKKLTAILRESIGDNLLVLHADAKAEHQMVVQAMTAARLAGIKKLTFATDQEQ
jgi:biopolymer transport protein ExbD